MASESTLTINFTQDKLLKIIPPKINRDIYKDTKEKGLILIVSYGSSKIFYFYKKIQGKPYRIKIGAFPDLSVGEARDKAIEYKNKIAKGINPAEEKGKLSNEMTFKELFDKYINEYAKHNTKSWKDDIAEMDRKAKHLYSMKLSDITRDEMNKLFNRITDNTGKGGANRFLDRLRAVFNKAIEWGWEGSNPTSNIKKHKQKSRDRYLTSEELPNFFEALDEENHDSIKDFIWIALLTGARKSNVLAMEWQYVNFKDKTWYIPETKNDTSQLIPLVDEALIILEARSKAKTGKWVFPSKLSKSGHLEEPKKVWRKILERATCKIWLSNPSLKEIIKKAEKSNKMDTLDLFTAIQKQAGQDGLDLPNGILDVRLHDLRRTLGSWLAHSGASQFIIGKSLNHKSTKSTAVYARLSIDPIRESMDNAVKMMRGKK
ncbi:MAG: tyrosine-type recombinase/integrase [Pseudomonadota bacterium]